jgi:hypothetical protein
MLTKRTAVGVVCLLVVWSTTACASALDQPTPMAPPEPTGPTLPPRPFELRIDDLDPCAALSLQQILQLKLHFQRSDPSADGGGPTCFWAHSSEEPIEGYAIRRNMNGGIEQTFGNPRGVTGTTVAGFPAVETQNLYAPPETSCIIGVDVADEQGLQINYDYTGSTAPMTRDLACQKAKAAAEMAMQTLLTRAGR